MSDGFSEVRILSIDVGQCDYGRHVALYVVGRKDRENGFDLKMLDVDKGWVDSPQEDWSGIREPSLVLTMKQAQALVNGLWDSGIRPAQAKGSSGQLEAVNRHLEDMRKIAFMHIEPKKEE